MEQVEQSEQRHIIDTLRTMTDDLVKSLSFKKLGTQLRQLKLPSFSWPSFRIGDLEIKKPVVQGGMGVGISLSGLASAVAEQGGVGIIAANAIGMIEKDYFKDGKAANIRAFRNEIRKARKKTNGVIGVNIMVAVNDFHDLMQTAIEEKVDLIVMGAGLPIKNLPVEEMRANNVKAIPIVSSVRAMTMIFSMWKKIYKTVPDAVVFEGPKAGGHLGFSEDQIDDPAFQLEALVPELKKALQPFEEEFNREIPLIAGGGIYSGEDIYHALKLGASAVQMGTRFVATEECDADDVFKESYISCSKEDIGLIKSPVGMPGRAIQNDFLKDAAAGKRPNFKCAWQCLGSCKAESAHYCISIALNNARRGKLSQGFVFAGSNAYRVEKIQSVKELLTELSHGYVRTAKEQVFKRLEPMLKGLQDLQKQYQHCSSRINEIRLSYEEALSNRLQKAANASVEQLRTQYESLQSMAVSIQLTLAEKLTESWKLLGAEPA
jgi:nitronate monooxygenase